MKTKAFIYLRTKVDKVDFIVLRLILPPGRPEGFFLEAPVRSKDVIEKEETVASSPQLKDLQHNLRLPVCNISHGLTWEFLSNPNPMNLSSKAGVFPRET